MAKLTLDQLEGLLSPLDTTFDSKKLKILIVGAEVSPYANVGGYARVLAYLAGALKKEGHDVRLFMPKFGFIDEEKYPMDMVVQGLKVPTDDENTPELVCNIKQQINEDNVPVYFLENREYYELRANVYGYQDDPLRWALLSRAAIEFVKDHEWTPDIIHCNDWHSGHIPNYLKTTYKSNKKLSNIATLFTIHNLMMQGWYINIKRDQLTEMDSDDGHSAIAPLTSDRLPKQNFVRRGIIYSDYITTVSKTYAKEILKPEYGEGLDRLLTEMRGKLVGVVNGVDFDKFDPATDKLIVKNYTKNSLDLRVKNKTALQQEFDLIVDEAIPVLSYVGRMEEQKGVDLIADVMFPLMKDFNVQFIAVGGGDPRISDRLRELQKAFPDKVGVHLMPDFTLPRLVFSGSDMVLVPSRFEPCGIVQMEAMRYGAIPIVRSTGGLADTVKSFEPETGKGWGFVFNDFDAWGFFAQIVRALEIYRQKKTWKDMQRQAMNRDNSWESRAEEYADLYEKAIQVHKQGLVDSRANL